jgi:sugar phosphate isomerase/epimerase
MVELSLGINAGFASNRFPEHSEWLRIVGEELGLKYVQFVTDLLDPLFTPERIKEKAYREIERAVRRYGLRILFTFASTYSRRNQLMHPDRDMRELAFKWYKAEIDQAARLRAEATGSNFGIMSVLDSHNPKRREFITKEAIHYYQALLPYACKKGLKYLFFEPMSIPRERPCTVRDTIFLMKACSQGAPIPMKLLLDVGHGYIKSPCREDRDPYLWVERLAAFSPAIHIRQTDKSLSPVWPFTEEYNRRGIIRPEKVIAAIEKSGAKKVCLLLEISHRERSPMEERVIDDLKESVKYWRRFVQEDA